MKCVMRFEEKGQLSRQYIDPYPIIKKKLAMLQMSWSYQIISQFFSYKIYSNNKIQFFIDNYIYIDLKLIQIYIS